MDMMFGLVRFMYQGMCKGYQMTNEEAIKACSALYLNKREYEAAEAYRNESRQFLLGSVILGVNTWSGWFSSERDTLMKGILDDLSLQQIPLTNFYCLGALIYLGMIENFKKFRIQVEQELARLEPSLGKEPLWEMAVQVLRGRITREEAQRLSEDTAAILAKLSDGISTKVYRIDMNKIEMLLWLSESKDLDQDLEDLMGRQS